MRRRVAVALVALIALGAALYAAGPVVACFVAEPLRARFLAAPLRPPDCGPAMPSLTPEQEAGARDIALGDARVRDILGGPAEVATPVASWTAGTCLIGAVPELRLGAPRTVAFDWPTLRWEPSTERPEYPPVTHRATVVDLASILVWVDLERREVVQIAPGGGRIVEPLTPGLVAERVWRRLTHCPE